MFVDDVRHAARRMRAKPAMVLAAAAMLALAIGLTTTMFTLADALLLRPVPFNDPERLAQIYMGSDRGGRMAVVPAVFRAWRSSAAFESVESAAAGTVVIETGAGPIARSSATVTTGVLTMLGVRPVRGRLFQPDEGRAGSTDRALISEDVWRSTFASDRTLVGRRIVIDGEPVLVVGIVPSDFRFPQWDTVVWRPIDFDALPADRRAELPISFVRFASNLPQADALRVATEAAHQAEPATATLRTVSRPLAGLVLNTYYQRAVPLLFGGVGLVFFVLCANVSSLLLVRLTERRREFSMCAALGASRARLLGQAFLESAMLGAIGCVAGIGLASALVAAARAFLPEAFLLRTLNPLNLDLRAVVAASVAGALATLAAGVLPAWLGTRLDLAESLKTGDRIGTETRATRSVTRGLVVAEIALACTLLVGAVLLVRSFVNLAQVDRGLDSSGVVVATISLPASAFADAASRFAMTSTIEAEMRRLPGVEQVALSFGLPPDGGGIHSGDDWRSDVAGATSQEMVVESYEVGADFFDLYRIPILRGRAFQPGDTPQQVIVGERFAARLWPGIDPVGRSFSWGKTLYQVIGLTREINHPAIDPRLDRPEFYLPPQPSARSRSYFMVSLRCGATCPDGAVIRHRLLAVNAAVGVISVGPLDAEYFEQLAAPRAAAALAFVFAAVGVIAAAGGLFGVLSYAAGRRRHEFGIRVALGASQQQIRRLVWRDGFLVGTIGVVLGALAGSWLARGLASLQYGVSASDPVSWFVVIGVLGVTTAMAVWRPARHAAGIDPAILLREE